MAKTLTPEQLVKDAFFLFAPDGSDWEQYEKRRADLLSLIRTYGEAQAAAQRERIAQAINDIARSYSPANAVDEETSDYLSGAQSCAQRVLAALTPPPAPE